MSVFLVLLVIAVAVADTVTTSMRPGPGMGGLQQLAEGSSMTEDQIFSVQGVAAM